jgi:hypothetical protein
VSFVSFVVQDLILVFLGVLGVLGGLMIDLLGVLAVKEFWV